MYIFPSTISDPTHVRKSRHTHEKGKKKMLQFVNFCMVVHLDSMYVDACRYLSFFFITKMMLMGQKNVAVCQLLRAF